MLRLRVCVVVASFLLLFTGRTEAQTQGCQWTSYPNTLIYGGNDTASATDLPTCQTACLSRPGCQSIDWAPGNPGTKCFLFSKKSDKVSNIQGVTHYDYDCPNTTCQWQWQQFLNTNIYGGRDNNATSLAACQSACILTPDCVGVDYSRTNPTGQQCFLLQTQAGKNNVNNVDHYDLIRCNITTVSTTPSTPTSTSSPPLPAETRTCETNLEILLNTSSVGGLYVPEILISRDCLFSCMAIPSCLGTDTSGPGFVNCYMHFNRTTFPMKYFQENVNQYKLNRCPTEGLGKCNPTNDNNGNLNDSCASVCYPTWDKLDNTAGTGGGPWMNVTDPWEFRTCLGDCLTSSDCIGVEVKEFPGMPRACRKYTSSQRNGLTNITIQAFITQYRILDPCSEVCKVVWDRLQGSRVRYLSGPATQPSVQSEAECLKACRISTTCEAAEWRTDGGSPRCSLYDEYIPFSASPNSTYVTYIYREICPVTLPTTPAGVTSATTPAGGCQWFTYANSNIYGGSENPAGTVDDCKKACLATSGCKSIDWSPTNPSGSRCFLLQTQNGRNANINSVDHYDYVCNGTVSNVIGGVYTTFGIISATRLTDFPTSSTTKGSSDLQCFQRTQNMLIYGGSQSSSQTLDQCAAACRALSTTQCASFDWDNTRPVGTQCFLLNTTQNKRPTSGVDHYDRIC